ncbi:hypothetical protein SESBI_17368 [Sesbania bispinosa]|nr:hypothetical protein SESBI_17368 [Sesbania bispinosa]
MESRGGERAAACYRDDVVLRSCRPNGVARKSCRDGVARRRSCCLGVARRRTSCCLGIAWRRPDQIGGGRRDSVRGRRDVVGMRMSDEEDDTTAMTHRERGNLTLNFV